MLNAKDKNQIKIGTSIFKRECGELTREGYVKMLNQIQESNLSM